MNRETTARLERAENAASQAKRQCRHAMADVDTLKGAIVSTDGPKSKARKEALRTAETMIRRALADLVEAEYHLNKFRGI